MGSTLASNNKASDADQKLLPPPAKRARIDPKPGKQEDENDNNCITNATTVNSNRFQFLFTKGPSSLWPIRGISGPHKGPQQTKWERLPYVALVDVFRHLPNRDRCNAALACRAWLQPLYEPMLWRRGNFRFNGLNERGAMFFARRFGKALRHLSIECAATSGCRSARNLANFVSILLDSGNSKLVSLRLANLSSFRKQLRAHDRDVIHLLLAAPRTLTSLDFEYAGIDVDQGFQMLASVVTSSGTSVHTLRIAEFFWPDVHRDIHQDPRLFSLLAGFPVLKELSISYDLLSDDLLFLLASCVTFTLTQISVVCVSCAALLESRTTSRAWTHLTFKCPRLSANFHIKKVMGVRSIQMMLLPGTPLTRLKMETPGVYTYLVTPACLEYLVTNFHECLHHLELNLYLAGLNAVEELTRLVQQCQRLETLHITSGMMDRRQELCAQRALRRVISRGSGSRLKEVTLNGEEVNLVTNWTSALIDWLIDQV